MDTSGFYKIDNNEILMGPNFVEGISENIYREYKDTYAYPIDGWYWFDTIQEAYTFWNLQIPQHILDAINKNSNTNINSEI